MKESVLKDKRNGSYYTGKDTIKYTNILSKAHVFPSKATAKRFIDRYNFKNYKVVSIKR